MYVITDGRHYQESVAAQDLQQVPLANWTQENVTYEKYLSQHIF